MSYNFVDNSQQALTEKDKAIESALEIVGGLLERYAKQNLTESKAVDTGLLRNSVTYAISGKKPAKDAYHADREKNGEKRSGGYSGVMGSSDEHAVYVGTNVEYAPYIEMGTSKMAPRPFLKPAVESHISQYQHIIANELKKVGK